MIKKQTDKKRKGKIALASTAGAIVTGIAIVEVVKYMMKNNKMAEKNKPQVKIEQSSRPSQVTIENSKKISQGSRPSQVTMENSNINYNASQETINNFKDLQSYVKNIKLYLDRWMPSKEKPIADKTVYTKEFIKSNKKQFDEKFFTMKKISLPLDNDIYGFMSPIKLEIKLLQEELRNIQSIFDKKNERHTFVIHGVNRSELGPDKYKKALELTKLCDQAMLTLCERMYSLFHKNPEPDVPPKFKYIKNLFEKYIESLDDHFHCLINIEINGLEINNAEEFSSLVETNNQNRQIFLEEIGKMEKFKGTFNDYMNEFKKDVQNEITSLQTEKRKIQEILQTPKECSDYDVSYISCTEVGVEKYMILLNILLGNDEDKMKAYKTMNNFLK